MYLRRIILFGNPGLARTPRNPNGFSGSLLRNPGSQEHILKFGRVTLHVRWLEVARGSITTT